MKNIDLTYEKNFLDLLGYSLIGPDNSNRWNIYDEENNQVGFIQYKKIYKGNKKKDYPATYAYIIEINSKNIIFNNTRKVLENGLNKIDSQQYLFKIKRDDDIDQVDMNIGEFLDLHIWSKQYGFSVLKIDYSGLYVYFNSKTENFNIEEIIIYGKVNELLANYTYQIKYCNKNRKLSDNKYVTTREISGYSLNEDKIKIYEKTWINNILKTKNTYDVSGTIDEMINLHEMGIDAFNHYRYLLGKILPFKVDFIDQFVTNEMIEENSLSLFIEKENEKKLKKN